MSNPYPKTVKSVLSLMTNVMKWLSEDPEQDEELFEERPDHSDLYPTEF